MDDHKAQLLSETQQLLFNNRFDSADSLQRDFARIYPDDPGCYLIQAAIEMAKMAFFEDNLYPDYAKLLDTLRMKAQMVSDSGSASTKSWMHLFVGHSKAYGSIRESRFGSLYSAIRLGLAAKSEYEAGLALDSSIYDHYMGIGTYHYWKSAKAGMLRWIGLFKNDRALGIKELYIAADSAQIFKESARSGLIWIWINKEKYDSAIAVAEEMQKAYPDGTSFLWPMAQAYFAKRDYVNTARIYRLIRDKIDDTPGNYFNLIECDYFISKCLVILERKDEAIAAARDFAVYQKQIPNSTYNRQKSHISFLRKLVLE
ncbi:MAG: hypothetical protein SGI97_00815 [candidate division Zixibacteria bacterium]|nr:hypothetical protein [candidate division Zixibacteria bacterium]